MFAFCVIFRVLPKDGPTFEVFTAGVGAPQKLQEDGTTESATNGIKYFPASISLYLQLI